MARRINEATYETTDDDQDAGLLDPFRAFLNADDARVARIMQPLRDRYVSSKRDDEIKKHLKCLIQNAVAPRNSKLPPSIRNRKAGVGLVIVAPSGAGKSTTLDYILRNHPAFPGYGDEDQACRLVFVQAPAPCTLGQLGNAALKALGYPIEKPLPENEAWARVLIQVERQKVLILYFGDINHVMHLANFNEIVKVADTFKNLMISKGWPVQLIMDGTPDMIAFPKGDRQFSRRLKFVTLGNISPKEDHKLIETTVKDYAKRAGLKLATPKDDMLIGRLCRAAAFQMGLIIEILLDAIEVSVTARRTTLTKAEFAEAYAEKTTQPVDLNMFLSPTWHAIDPSIIIEEPELPDGAKKSKRTVRRKY